MSYLLKSMNYSSFQTFSTKKMASLSKILNNKIKKFDKYKPSDYYKNSAYHGLPLRGYDFKSHSNSCKEVKRCTNKAIISNKFIGLYATSPIMINIKRGRCIDKKTYFIKYKVTQKIMQKDVCPITMFFFIE